MSKVRCNNCEKEFDEKEIVFDDSSNAEYCPYCRESGCLMDVEDNEGTTLWCITNSMLKEKPYLNYYKHKDMIAVCVSEHFSEEGEYIFYIEKDWLHEYVKTELGIEDVDYWLQNEYTSDESEPILLEGIEAGVVSGIYK